MESKIKIKLGPIEVEYEGSESFLKQELPALIKTVTELSKSAGVTLGNIESNHDKGKSDAGMPQLSITSIATKIPCSSGPDLVLAAAAHLTLVKKSEVFSRKQLLDEMKAASGFYKSSYRDNLTAYLKSLLKDKLNERSTGQYSLSESARKELESKLAR